jgi:3-oxoacyl-[acyl-carrier protein] reductase
MDVLEERTRALDDLSLDGQTVVVTGGADGIGWATALRAHALGARVAVLDVCPIDDGRVLSLISDVADSAMVSAASVRVEQELGPASVLINNAGIALPGKFEQVTEASWRRTIEVNLTGMFVCAKAFLPQLRRNHRSSIVNVSSQAARFGSLAADVSYAASKGGVLSLTLQLAKELADEGIRVNCVCPGAVDTGIPRRNLSESERAAMLRNVPLGRAAAPAEIAAVICFLASDAASYMTGAAVDVNGGVI